MSIFDKFKKPPASPASESETFMPNMTPQEASVAEQATLNSRERRAAAEAANLAANESTGENEGVPSINRRRAGNQFVTVLGIIFILLIGAVLIFQVNKTKVPIKSKQLAESDRVSNTMPPLVLPAAPPPPPALAAPVVATAPGVQPIPLKGGSTQQQPKLGPNGKPIVEWYDRKRAGELMVGQGSGGSSSGGNSGAVGVQQVAGVPASGASLDGSGGSRNDLALRLEPTVTRAASANLLPDRNYLITKGTTLDCALETALDSTVPGITTCRLTRDVYSDNGQVVLLDRGSQLTGEYQGGLRQGQARIFTLWTRAKTPNGVVVALNSPGTDALGRSGLEGWVDTHFAARFGAAIMFSLLKDGLAVIAANQQRSGGGQIVYGNTQQAGEQAVGKVLDSTINIPPTLIKNQGDHIQVMVARDLDFSSVYALRSKE